MNTNVSLNYSITVSVTVVVPTKKFFGSLYVIFDIASVIREEEVNSFTLLYDDMFLEDAEASDSLTVRKFLTAIADRVTSDGLNVDEITFIYNK